MENTTHKILEDRLLTSQLMLERCQSCLAHLRILAHFDSVEETCSDEALEGSFHHILNTLEREIQFGKDALSTALSLSAR